MVKQARFGAGAAILMTMVAVTSLNAQFIAQPPPPPSAEDHDERQRDDRHDLRRDTEARQPDAGERQRDRGEASEPRGEARQLFIPPDRRDRDRDEHWRLGVYSDDTATGVRVTQVIRGTAAWRAGLESGDLIVTVDGYQVGFVNGRLYDLGAELQRRAGRSGRVTLLVQNRRNDQLVNVDVQLTRERPRHYQRDRLEREDAQ